MRDNILYRNQSMAKKEIIKMMSLFIKASWKEHNIIDIRIIDSIFNMSVYLMWLITFFVVNFSEYIKLQTGEI